MSLLTNILESTIEHTIRNTSVKATLNTLAIVLLTVATALGTITITGCQKENEEVVITIDTQPQQARIFIDDRYVGVSPLTLSVADSPAKRYQVTAKKTGFYTYRTETTLVGDYSIALLPHEREIRMRITPGANRVSLHSTALDTPLVYTARSRTTQEISATLPYGTYTLFAWRQGLSFLEKTFTIDAQTPPTIPVRFSEVFARTALTVTSRPANAQVYYQDLLLGNTPLTLSNLASGTTFLRVAKHGYHDVTVSVNLRPNEQKNIPLTLAKQTITQTVIWKNLPRPVTLSFTQTQTAQGTSCVPNCKKNTWQFNRDPEEVAEVAQAADPVSLSLAPGTYTYSILSPQTYPYSGEILIAGEEDNQASSSAGRTAEEPAHTAPQTAAAQVLTQSPVLHPRLPPTLKPIARLSLRQKSLRQKSLPPRDGSEQGNSHFSSQQERLIAAANQTLLASQGKLTGLLHEDTGIYLQQHNLPHAWNHAFTPLSVYNEETSETTPPTTAANTPTQPPLLQKNENESFFVAASLPLTSEPLLTLASTLSRIHAKDILSPFFILTEKRPEQPSFTKNLSEVSDITYIFDNSQSTLTRNISSPTLPTPANVATSNLISQEQVSLKECLYTASRTDDGAAGTEGLVLLPIVGQAVLEASLPTETKIVFSDTANDRVWRLHWEEASSLPTCSLLLLKSPSSEASFAGTSPTKSAPIQSLTLLQYAQGESPILSVGEKETLRMRLYSDEGVFFDVIDLDLATSPPSLNKRFATLSALIPSWLRKENASENFEESINTLLYLFAPQPNVLIGLVEHRFPNTFTYSLYIYDISSQISH